MAQKICVITQDIPRHFSACLFLFENFSKTARIFCQKEKQNTEVGSVSGVSFKSVSQFGIYSMSIRFLLPSRSFCLVGKNPKMHSWSVKRNKSQCTIGITLWVFFAVIVLIIVYFSIIDAFEKRSQVITFDLCH